MTEVIVGEGIVNWMRIERQTDRYGAVCLRSAPMDVDEADYPLTLDQVGPLDGKRGTLSALILEARESQHIGDLLHGFLPRPQNAGTRITLGSGTFFADKSDGVVCVGMKPDDDRHHFWLDPQSMYDCHNQTVRLIFTPETLS